MRYQHTAFAKLQKLRQDRLYLLCIHNHIICYACQFLYFKRNRNLRIDKRRKPVHDFSTRHLHGANLYNTIFHRREAGRLNIKDYEVLFKILALLIGCYLMQIIYQIRLYPIDYLEEILFIRVRISGFLPFILLCLPQILPYMIGIREGLYHTMICNRNGRVTPLIGTLHNILCLRHTIHITHLRMAVELHTLTHTCIHTGSREIRNFLHTHKRTDGQLMVKLIHHGHSLDFYKGSGFNTICYLCNLLIVGKHFDGHGIRVISHIID